YGSHRFHPQAEPEVMQDIARLLGDDLLLRPRHGRIRLGGRWVHFPLKPLDALLNLPFLFTLALLRDALAKPFARSQGPRTFASVLYRGLGRTIAENFYFPYVSKLWGRRPTELSVTLAERRVASGSVLKILLKMAKMIPGLRGPTTGRFYYPRRGFGQITERLAEAAVEQGAELALDTTVKCIEWDEQRVEAVVLQTGDNERRIENPILLSTIPLTALTGLFHPPPPQDVIDAAHSIEFRGMILIYLVLESDQFSEFDAHYFPELSVPISRMSEPKNYSAAMEPDGVTVLCAELPCDPGERWWSLSDEEFVPLMQEWLSSVDLPITCAVRSCRVRRLAHAYPVYSVGYEKHLETVDDWSLALEGLVSFGRQGLFAHDNSHHAIAMAYAVDDCLNRRGEFDAARWADYRREFLDHTVED
ncbi:MAG: FAD-dependent oxidoreductase, partial [Pseudomonadota bacterium]